MKKRSVFAAAAVMLAAALILAGCSNPAGDGSGVVPPSTGTRGTDEKPNMAVAKTPAEIPAFDAGILDCASEADARAMYDAVQSEVQDLVSQGLSSFSFRSNQSGSARAVKSEALDFKFSADQDLQAKLSPATLTGYAKGRFQYDDENFVPFSLSNGEAKFRIEFNGYTSDNYKIQGACTGTGTANVSVTANQKGNAKANGSVTYAISVSDSNSGKGIKCIVTMDLGLSASNSSSVKVTIKNSVKVYDSAGKQWYAETDTQSETFNPDFMSS